jgi:hypothetical protein
MKIGFAVTASVVALFVVASAAQEDIRDSDGSWVGAITTEGGVTIVDNQPGSGWGGTAKLVDDVSIGVEANPDSAARSGMRVGIPFQGPLAREDLYPSFSIYEWKGEYPNFVATPTSVAIYEDEIYVLDTGNKRVAVFDLSGSFERAFGREGQGPGELGLGSGRSITGPDLAVVDGRVYVEDPPQRRVHVFDLHGEIIGSYVPREGRLSINSIAAANGKVYLLMAGSQNESGGEIFVFEPRVEGGAVFSEPMIAPRPGGAPPPDRSVAPNPTGVAAASRFNQSQIATAPDGRILQAYWWWPILRIHRPGSITDARFVDDSWWEGRGFEEALPFVRTWFDQAREHGSPSGFSRRPFFFDVEYVAAINGWAALSNGDYVELFRDDRRLLRQFRLLPPDDEDVSPIDIAVDERGSLLCAADSQRRSEVLCYRIPGTAGSSAPLPTRPD